MGRKEERLSFMQTFQPKTTDIVAQAEQIKKLRTCIEEKTPVILHGPPGIGKTSSVLAIAKELGYHVIETNASDDRTGEKLKPFIIQVQTNTFRKVLFLFDEIDGVRAEATFLQIIDKSIHPVVMTANELWKIPKKIVNKCSTIKFNEPQLQDVMVRVKQVTTQQKVKGSFEKAHRDIRSSINVALYKSDGYSDDVIFDTINKIFEGKEYEKIDVSILPWLIDNAPRFYYGKKLYDFYQLLCNIDLTGKLKLLDYVEKGRTSIRAVYPYYLRRLTVLKGGVVQQTGNETEEHE